MTSNSNDESTPRFDTHGPQEYAVVFEDKHGNVGQTEPMPYRDTTGEDSFLEAEGKRVMGVVRDTSKDKK